MKTATFDGGFHFDDPNLRWGDPSYLLEPGAPGYVAPAQNIPGVAALGIAISDPPQQGEVQATVDKVDEMINALVRP